MIYKTVNGKKIPYPFLIYGSQEEYKWFVTEGYKEYDWDEEK